MSQVAPDAQLGDEHKGSLCAALQDLMCGSLHVGKLL